MNATLFFKISIDLNFVSMYFGPIIKLIRQLLYIRGVIDDSR